MTFAIIFIDIKNKNKKNALTKCIQELFFVVVKKRKHQFIAISYTAPKRGLLKIMRYMNLFSRLVLQPDFILGL
jgi:hypothetical protein